MNRGERRARTERVCWRRVRVLRDLGVGFSSLRHMNPGCWASRHPLDCGRPGCGTCSVDRRIAGPTVQEQREAQDPAGLLLDRPLDPLDPFDTDWSWLARRLFGTEPELLAWEDYG